MAKTWRQKALEVINEAYPNYWAEHPDLTAEEILSRISREQYPFGRRENFPYQAWLKAIKDCKRALKSQPLFNAEIAAGNHSEEDDSERSLFANL